MRSPQVFGLAICGWVPVTERESKRGTRASWLMRTNSDRPTGMETLSIPVATTQAILVTGAFPLFEYRQAPFGVVGIVTEIVQVPEDPTWQVVAETESEGKILIVASVAMALFIK